MAVSSRYGTRTCDIQIQGCLSNLNLQCCGSGSGALSNVSNVKLNYTFSREFQYIVQNIENFDTYDADKKGKTIYTGTVVNKSKFLFF